jgi:uncharacterized ion transporter superfamily protein YfcC
MTSNATNEARRRGQPHPVLIVLTMMVVTIVLTYLIPAGKFQRHGGHLVPSSYQLLPKTTGLSALLSPTAPVETDSPARAAGVVALFTAIPAGLVKSAATMFMVMFVGGMFGILRATGAIDAGVDRLLHLTSGNVYLLAAGLLLLLACGSTFLGFSSEYLAIIPLVLALGHRLRLPNLFAPAVVALADFIGYTASVTNPVALAVAQPLAGVPVFSGLLPRLVIFIVMFALSLGYVLFYLTRLPKVAHIPETTRLTKRQVSVLASVVLGGAALVTGTGLWSWGSPELAAAFIALGLLVAFVGGLRPAAAADAFVEGMKGMWLVCLLIGLAGATVIILQSSQVMDSIVEGIASLIQGHPHSVVAEGLMAAEMIFGVLIPSVTSKAAASIPILAPIAHLSGVSGQMTVTALLLGSGLTNIVTPTNPLLLAFLAASKVDYIEWLRFIAPLFAMLCIVSFAALYLMTAMGF